jgi:hypothetical protein
MVLVVPQEERAQMCGGGGMANGFIIERLG